MADNYNVEVKITSHKKEVVAELEQAMLQALEAIGMEAEGHAQDTIRTAGFKHPTGNLLGSITHQVKADENAVYIGSPVHYAKWWEWGTGIFAEGEGGGRKDVPWFYVDEDGVGHLTSGVRALHFLKKAATEHGEQYKALIEAAMK